MCAATINNVAEALPKIRLERKNQANRNGKQNVAVGAALTDSAVASVLALAACLSKRRAGDSSKRRDTCPNHLFI